MNPIPKLVSFLEKKAATGSLMVRLYARWYHGVINNEIALAGITSTDRVLIIGCGGIPYTAFLMANFTGAKVFAIDRDQEAVQAAQNCVASLGINSKMNSPVTLAAMDGTHQFPFTFNVALVTLQAEPKKEILHNLMKQGQAGSRLIFRRPRHHLGHQYDLLPEKPKPTKVVQQNQATFDASVLYMVKEAT